MLQEDQNIVQPNIPSVAETMMGMGGYAYRLEQENKLLRAQLYEYEHPTNRPCMKVVVWLMLVILKMVGVTTANTDRSRLSRIIAYVSGFPEKRIYECIAEDKPFAQCHEEDLTKAKQLFSGTPIALPE